MATFTPFFCSLAQQSPIVAIFYSDKWYFGQLASAIVCACLPTYGALLPRKKVLFLSLPALKASFRTFSNRSSASEATVARVGRAGRLRYNSLADRVADSRMGFTTMQTTSTEIRQFSADKDFPMNAIRVEKTLELQSSHQAWYSRVP